MDLQATLAVSFIGRAQALSSEGQGLPTSAATKGHRMYLPPEQHAALPPRLL